MSRICWDPRATGVTHREEKKNDEGYTSFLPSQKKRRRNRYIFLFMTMKRCPVGHKRKMFVHGY